jgi:glutamate carboxypeptidase
MNQLSSLTREDEAARERLSAAAAEMVARTRGWSAINTGSYNIEGLKTLAPKLADAFSALEADVALVEGPGFENVGADGRVSEMHTGPIIEVVSRPSAPIQVVMSGHYDTVFPPGTFETIQDLGNGQINGPGMADMKGGLSLMLEALKAFEAGPFKEATGLS